MYADIILDITHEKLDKCFQYRVPSEMEADIKVGSMVEIPFGNGNRVMNGYVVGLSEEPKFDPKKTKAILSLPTNKVGTVSEMIELAAWLKKNYGGTMSQALSTVIPVKDKVQVKQKKILTLELTKEEAEEVLSGLERKHAVQQIRLLTELMKHETLDFDLVKDKLHITAATVNALAKKDILSIEYMDNYRNPVKKQNVQGKTFDLNPKQQEIVDAFSTDWNAGIRQTYLIHGVTGSGKTAVYLDLIEKVLADGKECIVLIPEIALTYQTVQRFYARFGDEVSIINSRLSRGERYDQFLRAMKGEIKVMIGPRSALFTPFRNLGLIVIDEEQEEAYKSEQSPKYHARETAIHIAEMKQASVVLGSATPSVTAYYHASQGDYRLFELPDRALASSLPTVYVDDMREELKAGNRQIFSRRLYELMKDRLDRKEQIMLFLNKRGYAGYLSCRACGLVFKCPHCDVSMTYHRQAGILKCHYCGHVENAPKTCPKCGSVYVAGFRAGTEQVEEQVRRLFPDARTLRMDLDTTSGKDGHEKILAAFANHEADILVGTQMIVKGHDFPDVTLVGIIAADMSLNASNYRAAERTFILLTQAAGRAGRDGKKGEVVIQTYSPEHYSIVTSASQDYKAFYNEEIMYRQMLSYPPVQNMMTIFYDSEKEEALKNAGKILKGFLKEAEETWQGIRTLGPVDADIYRMNDRYRQVAYVKCPDYGTLTEIKDAYEKVIAENKAFAYVYTQFDFNA